MRWHSWSFVRIGNLLNGLLSRWESACSLRRVGRAVRIYYAWKSETVFLRGLYQCPTFYYSAYWLELHRKLTGDLILES